LPTVGKPDRGDVPGREGVYQRAIAHQAAFGPNDHSPQKSGADLAKLGVEISQLRPASNDPTPGPQRPQDAVAGPGDNIPLSPRSSANDRRSGLNPINYLPTTIRSPSPRKTAFTRSPAAWRPRQWKFPRPAGHRQRQ
jgi:hypothetical protein